MINEHDRISLISYRINQAKDSIELVRFLISTENLSEAVNRIYYGMYYALTALALKRQIETSKHQQLIGWFNKEFVANKLTDIKYGKMVRLAYHNRRKGDYDAFVSFTHEEVDNMLLDMVDFINEIQKLTSDH